ncbi:MAG: hypothetical protein J6J16_00615 [Lachnospiraceae bacterium]|nr:hypothetical protein [Lachnospiraceae bacterium]
MKIYLQSGIAKDINNFINEIDTFHIRELEGERLSKYVYPGDEINYTLDGKLCRLYDTLRDMIFEDTGKYYQELSLLPIWVQEAGQNSDCGISVDTFNEWVGKSGIPNLYKHLYLVDCQFLVGTIQNLLCAMEDAFIRYYKIISLPDGEDQYIGLVESNGVIFMLSQSSTSASSVIETYFTKAYSILDIVCKICYEIQFKQEDFSSYKKMKSADVLWGNRKKLTINGMSDTLFEKCEFISTIEALRNELVHNGTWELNPKKFIRFENGQAQERFMLFPDMSQGHLSTAKNRKHFFASGIKVNDILPKIHAEFKNRLLKTIEIMNKI